ncbi:MAG TPA: type VI secretion system tube protein Hcp [Phycisphaerae bacterium]|jgi:type VI secretion system secreted protein Hcp
MANDFYLHLIDTKTGVVKGEATDAAFTEEIQLSGFTIEIDGPDLDAAGSADSGHCVFHELQLKAPASVASSVLFYLCCTGEIVKQATITCRKAGGGKVQPFIQWRFHRAQISYYKQEPAEGGVLDSFNLKFSKVEMGYFKQKPDGSFETSPRTAGWDQDQNASLKTTLPHPKK